ncbi:MAG: hypothetical protein KJP26_04775 [Maribacter sp.]|nr:hypothetical protein [Maribacter sp.]NNK18874.1 hypothetical protein [Maribacter sp.]
MIENNAKKKIKRKIVVESIFVFFIALSPFLYKVYDYLPEDPEATISIFGLVIDNNGFGDVSMYVWFIMSKIIPLYLMIFWFMTAKNWWYHIILIPIAMYAFQLFEVIFDSDDIIDTENIWWLIPICMVIIPIVYFFRIKLYDKYVHGIDLEAMDAELQTIKKSHPEDNRTSTTDNANQDPIQEYDEPQVGYQSFSDYLNSAFSTNNIEHKFKRFQNNLKGWLHLKF